MGTQTGYTQAMTKGGVMTGAPFKRGERVVLKQNGLERVFGTVFWVKQNADDKFIWKQKKWVKVASKGAWTVGVDWDSEFRYPVMERVIPRKFIGAGALRAFTEDDAQVEKRMLERYPDPQCVFCGDKATAMTQVQYPKPYKGRLTNCAYIEYCCEAHRNNAVQMFNIEEEQK